MSESNNAVPTTSVDRLLTPLRRFLRIQSASGIVLLVCAIVSIALANSPWAHAFAEFWETHVELSVGSFTLSGSLGHLVVNDGLMTIFFFVVGLEIKRELVSGELADWRKALLPILAAAGGMVVPAVVYLALQWGKDGQDGWAIPMATDIAFVVGLLALFGDRVPFGLKIFLLSLAIVDDIGAILIIALVFSETLMWSWLAVAALGLAATVVLNRIGVRAVGVYVLVGAFIWLAFYKSGVHPTVAGVLLGLLTPAKAWLGRSVFPKALVDIWHGGSGDDAPVVDDPVGLKHLRLALRESASPLQRLDSALHPWVAFVIMPIFALANAGVPLELGVLAHPVSLAVAAGLVVGKPLGILATCALARWLKVTTLPQGVTWPMLVGGACLAGIGFTMALFLNALSFADANSAIQAAAGKTGTLLGSLISAILGVGILLATLRKAPVASP